MQVIPVKEISHKCIKIYDLLLIKERKVMCIGQQNTRPKQLFKDFIRIDLSYFAFQTLYKNIETQ